MWWRWNNQIVTTRSINSSKKLKKKSVHLVWVGLFSQLAGGAVLAVGVWTLVEKSDYISLLSSSFYSASAYILIAAGAIVIVTGIIGCCATLREKKSLLIVVKWISYTCDRFPYWASLIAAEQTPLNSCLYPQLPLSVNPRWSSVVGLPSARLIMSEKLQDIFSSSDLDLAHAGGMNGITSCSACRAYQTHGRCRWKWYRSETGWFAWRCGYFCPRRLCKQWHYPSLRRYLLQYILAVFYWCLYFILLLIQLLCPSTVFVLVALYFPAGDHCRGSGLHYLPRGDRVFFNINAFGSFSVMWPRSPNFLILSNTILSFQIVLFLFHPASVLFKPSPSVKCCSCCRICFDILSACCPLPSYPLYCFHTLLISLSPLFLTPVFPFLLPGNALI